MKNFYQAHVSEVSIQFGRRPLTRFLDGMDGKNQRDTACVANAVADPGCDLGMNIVARRQFTACLGDSDNGSALTQFLASDAEV